LRKVIKHHSFLAFMKTGYVVADAMTTKPITVPPGVSIRDASRVMAERGIGSLLVVKDDKLVGIVTAEDIVARVSAVGKSTDDLVDDVITTQIIDIAPDADIYEAMQLMKEHDILHLPVREHGKLVGFLTFKDVLKIEPQLFDLVSEMAEIRRRPTGKEGYCQECGNYSETLSHKKGKLLCTYCVEEA
jgi:signal-transduction protein with cAMP-binding, CBS, and nucleotidyltransferase domain